SGTCTYNWETIPVGATGTGTFTGNTLTITGIPAYAVIRLKIEPTNFNRVNINNGIDKERLLNVEQWGAVPWSNMQTAFSGCNNMNCTASDIPDLSGVTDMSYMFDSCAALTGPANINNWNTGSVTNMQNLFNRCTLFNQPVGNWNTANVTNMSALFKNCSSFDQPIANWNILNVTSLSDLLNGAALFNQPVDNWNIANVTNMDRAFSGAALFNQPLSNWNTANVTTMNGMFSGAANFNQPVGNWSTANVTNMHSMFQNDAAFNQTIGNWNTSNVVNIASMFNGALAFNQPVGNWNTGNVITMDSVFADATVFSQTLDWNTNNVTSMNSMFDGATAFNQPIGNWNTANVTDMAYMFNGTTAFNQPIGNWNTGNVFDMTCMFCLATAFNQPIGNWNTGNVIHMEGMFNGATSFNQPIGNWNTGNVIHMGSMFSFGTIFNQPIGNWNTANVEYMSSMFMYSTAFNQPIGNWNTGNVKTMTNMFAYSPVFNQPIGNWNTSKVITMHGMFRNASAFNQTVGSWQVDTCAHMMFIFQGATSFNQSIGNWQLNPNVNLTSMLDNSGIDCNHYSSTLSGWANNLNCPTNRNLGAMNLEYILSAVSDRDYLINTKGWTINYDALDSNCCVVNNYMFNDTACSSYFFNGQTLTSNGVYYDTMVNAGGCDSLITLNLYINPPNITVTQAGALLTANATPASYQWLKCEPYSIINGATNQNYTAVANGTYAVIVTQNGCTDTSACHAVTGIGVNEIDMVNNIKTFPNPVSQFLQIEAERVLQNAEIRLLNTLGQSIAIFSHISDKTYTIDLSALTPGNYFIQIKDAKHNFVQKVRKE
ncbi:MAG: BspA family leucine-rich repeat surface protein, partial [Chitinophagaceae bacterium]|nr:BspA family leucine-rich repeat surface protein [Chitinophagaceae bacterium]